MAHLPGAATMAAMLVDVVHLMFLVYNACGALIFVRYILTRKGKRLFYVSIGLSIAAAFFQGFGFCPLTTLSAMLRQIDDPGFRMSGGFINYYANNLLHLGVTSRQIDLMILSLSVLPMIYTVILVAREFRAGRLVW